MIPLGRTSSPTTGGGASMEVGVGLPTTTPGADGHCLLEWARRAEDGPFASLGVLDRMVYPRVEPLPALAAAAAVTTRVRLVTMVVIGPLRNTALLAKQAASLDLLSGGRLPLGLAIGAPAADYRAPAAARGGPGGCAGREGGGGGAARRGRPRRRPRRCWPGGCRGRPSPAWPAA